jgi:hypothetical protein
MRVPFCSSDHGKLQSHRRLTRTRLAGEKLL